MDYYYDDETAGADNSTSKKTGLGQKLNVVLLCKAEKFSCVMDKSS